jgi:hypothetical protein
VGRAGQTVEYGPGDVGPCLEPATGCNPSIPILRRNEAWRADDYFAF